MISEVVRDVLVVDRVTSGEFSQPFEHLYSQVVVFDGRGADIRQHEKQGRGRYAIHHERIEAPRPSPCFDSSAEIRFFVAYQRAIEQDPADVRKAVRLALKGMLADGWPPG